MFGYSFQSLSETKKKKNQGMCITSLAHFTSTKTVAIPGLLINPVTEGTNEDRVLVSYSSLHLMLVCHLWVTGCVPSLAPSPPTPTYRVYPSLTLSH